MRNKTVAIISLALLFACAPKEEQQIIIVESISIDQADMSLEEGERVSLTATVLPENAKDKTVKWSSSDESAVVMSSSGQAVAIAVGKSLIIAQAGDVKDFITITVVAKAIPVTEITLNPAEVTIREGESSTVIAEITPPDATNKHISWTSSNDGVAKVEGGIVTGVKAGSAIITATTIDGGRTAECVVKVKSNLAPSITVGAEHISAVSVVLSGEANLESSMSADMTMGIMWSSNSGVLPSNSTKKTATEISAKSGFDASYSYSVNLGGLEPSSTYYYRSYITQNGQDTYGETKAFTTKDVASMLETKDATDVEPTRATMNAKLDLTDVQYKSLAYGFCWGTDKGDLNANIECAEIKDNSISAVLTGLSHKTQYWYKAYVIVDSQTFNSEVMTFTTDMVPVESVSLDETEYIFNNIGNTLTLNATILSGDATDKSIEWSSDNESVATVDQNGTLKAVGNGTATITVATKDQGRTATCSVTVAQWAISISLDVTSITLNEGQTQTLTATIIPDSAADKSLKWTSSDENVATVDQTGKIMAISKGTATIKAEANDGSGKYATCFVAVKRLVKVIELDKTSITVYNGAIEIITATVTPSDANDISITWASSNPSVATVSSSGLVTGKTRGNTVITATANDGSWIKATCEVEVKQYVTSITLSKTSTLLLVGQEETLSVTSILPDNANNKSYTWSSSNNAVAKVNTDGKVTAVSRGKATVKVTANDGSGVLDSCEVSVKNPCPSGAVDLGLSVYWATCNLGENGFVGSPEEYGDYYAWGETEPYYSSQNPLTWKDGKTGYNWASYKWCNGDIKKLTKYNTSSSYGTVDNKTVLDAEDDVAHVILGDKWRLPTSDEVDELVFTKNNTSYQWVWTSINGHNGWLVTFLVNSNSIFLPAGGIWIPGGRGYRNEEGYYMSSSLYTVKPYSIPIITFSCDNVRGGWFYSNRCNGFSVRPVSE